MRRDLLISLRAMVLFTVVLGLLYPLAITGISQVAFPGNADGSLVERDGKVVGSKLIGQDFAGKNEYFQSRPSATGYSGDATFFNNQGPNQLKLKRQIIRARDAYMAREGRFDDGLVAADIPPDAVTSSASGIDPAISVANARIQAHRVAQVRGLSLDRVDQLIDENTDGRGFGFMGNPGVNVLELNLALDQETP
jgi:K+-transporting ATPase ATPase C chain